MVQVFREVFDVAGWHASCEAAAAGIREEARMFKSLLDHCSEVCCVKYVLAGRACSLTTAPRG